MADFLHKLGTSLHTGRASSESSRSMLPLSEPLDDGTPSKPSYAAAEPYPSTVVDVPCGSSGSSSSSSRTTVLVFWGARLCAVSVSVIVTVFVAYASLAESTGTARAYGGLSACFHCNNGWNWHVLLFTLACSIAMTESIIAKRCSLLTRDKAKQRLVHMMWHSLSLVLFVAGLVSVIQSKLHSRRLHMNSLHGFCGSIVFAAFFLQYIYGAVIYMFFRGCVPDIVRKQAGSWHPIVGYLIFFGGIGTCVNGFVLMQKVYVQYGQDPYGSAYVFETIAGLLFWMLGALIFIEKSIDGRVTPTRKASDQWTLSRRLSEESDNEITNGFAELDEKEVGETKVLAPQGELKVGGV